MLSSVHKQLLNDYQHEFPLSPTPYKDIAYSLGVSEDDVLAMFNELSQEQFISRIGSVVEPNRIGVSSLVAMAVPPEKLKKVAEIVSQCPEVNHNYERENRFNLWFVVIAKDEVHLQSVIDEIEINTDFKVMSLPLLADYYINLGFEMDFDD